MWNEHSEGKILNTYVEKTPTGNGLHVFFRVPKELFNQPIVSKIEDGVEIKIHFTPIYPRYIGYNIEDSMQFVEPYKKYFNKELSNIEELNSQQRLEEI